MRVSVLAFSLAVATAAAAAEPTNGKGSSEADWVRQPTMTELVAVWPKAAMALNIGGSAILRCEVTTQGALEGCVVESETPAGMGFGAAALVLAPTFAMKPAMQDGKPVRSTVGIPIKWAAPGGGDLGSRLVSRGMTMLQDPVWASAPSFADMRAAWPAQATGDFGHVSVRCGFTREGALRACRVLDETPVGKGFGNAALKLVAPKFRVQVNPADADRLMRDQIDVPIQFLNPASNTPRQVLHPKWITTVDPSQVQAVYPAKAADAGIKSGRGVADCAIAADGHLVDCKPAYATPEGMGFAEAAVQVAQVMQMNPWTEGGSPVDGVRLRLPVSFNLAPEPAAAKH